ncbi:MAG: hypothetical protein M1608_16580 [Candidatus Omnitrophica bacterium]|nr:hypothetical protein [Candidatus Omnitrophota bacterium]
MFSHHPDGYIKIGSFTCSLREFLIDEPAYSLPSGMIGRRYIPDKEHLLYDGTTEYAQPIPWAEGDAYLAKEAVYLAAHVARWYLTNGIPVADVPDGAFTVIPARPGANYVFEAGVWRAKTVAELSAEKDAAALQLQHNKAAIDACLEELFAFVKNPTLHATVGSLLLAVITRYKSKLP